MASPFALDSYTQLFDDYPFLTDELDFPLPTNYQSFIAITQYSRYIDGLSRRESWQEIVFRFLNYIREQTYDFVCEISQEEMYEIYHSIISLSVFPSMRLLRSAGDAVKKNACSNYNCTYLPISDFQAFSELMYLSMSGCGVGFSVEKENVQQLPSIPLMQTQNGVIKVQDTRESWVHSFKDLLSQLSQGNIPKWDMSVIRPKGVRLKIAGGYSSGKEPLEKLFYFAINTFSTAQGRKLTPLECHDLCCMVGEIGVSGAIRRAATISYSDLKDKEMRDCKSGEWWKEHPYRSLANNSAVHTEDISERDFWFEWQSLQESGSGERGIFGEVAAQNKIKNLVRRDPNYKHRSNPCLSEQTIVLTKQGHFPIKDLVGKEVDVWNGYEWQTINNFRVTGENQPMLKITLHDNSEIRVTPYHTMILEDDTRIEAGNLEPGMVLKRTNAPEVHGTIHESGAYAKGFSVAEGTHNQSGSILWIYGPKRVCIKRLMSSLLEIPKQDIKATNINENLGVKSAGENRLSVQGLVPLKDNLLLWVTENRKELPTEIYNWDYQSKCEFIAGVLDGDGTASDTSHGFLYQITSIHKKWLQDFQLLLKTIGVASHLSLHSKAREQDFGDGYGTYPAKEAWRLTISQSASIILASQISFSRLVSFAEKETVYSVKPRWSIVKSIEEDGVDEKVYCCTVKGNHSFTLSNWLLIGQCNEILMRPYGVCNLSNVVIRPQDTVESIRKKVQIATVLGTIQSTITHFDETMLRPAWKENAEEERLLGVSLTGIANHPSLFSSSDSIRNILLTFKNDAVSTNVDWAKRLHIPRSAAITCLKPSGDSSQVANCSSGIHPCFSPYYTRRVRLSQSDPVAHWMIENNVPVEEDVYTPNTYVFSFPIRSSRGVYQKDISAIEHAEIWKMYNDNYTEHTVSCTVSVKEEEWEPLGKWVFQNRDTISGLSFLPQDNSSYQQMPYEAISEEEYNRMKTELPLINWNEFREEEDTTSEVQLFACIGDKCTL